MEVPFEHIGPGQQARIAMQVMGRDGPIFNPNGIRYVPVDSTQMSSDAPSNVAAGLAGMNLLLSTANLALSAETLRVVKKLGVAVDRLLDGQIRIAKRLETLITRLDKIDFKVSEARLAKLIDDACRSAASSPTEILFDPFQDLAGDLDNFVQEANIVIGHPKVIRLGSDSRRSLNHIVRLLRGVRLISAKQYNERVGPEFAWVCGNRTDYWTDRDLTLAAKSYLASVVVVNSWDFLSWRAHTSVDENFSMNGSDDHAAMQDALDSLIVDLWVQHGVDADQASSWLGECRETAFAEATDEEIPFLTQEHSDAYAVEVAAQAAQVWLDDPTHPSVIPPQVLEAASQDDDGDALLRDYASWWLYRTDAGLVHRALRECAGVRDGYQAVWSEALPDADEIGELVGARSKDGGRPEPLLINASGLA